MEEVGSALKTLPGTPIEKRPLARPRRRWEENIKMDLKEIGVDVTKLWIGITGLNLQVRVLARKQ